MAKTIDEIMAEARNGLTGEKSVDMVHLEHIAEEYAGTEIGKEVESQIADLAYEILPDDQKEKVAKMLYIDGKRMDKVFAERGKSGVAEGADGVKNAMPPDFNGGNMPFPR